MTISLDFTLTPNSVSAAHFANIRPPPGPAASPPLAGGGPSPTSELTIPNDLIGCIIGKGGAKINEIRLVELERNIYIYNLHNDNA